MPVSLRLPAGIEAQIAGYSQRAGLSKSALIVRSIQEFLARHTQPSSQQIYEEAMLAAQKREAMAPIAGLAREAKREAAVTRAHKLQVRDALRSKHAERAVRSAQALARSAVKSESKVGRKSSKIA